MAQLGRLEFSQEGSSGSACANLCQWEPYQTWIGVPNRPVVVSWTSSESTEPNDMSFIVTVDYPTVVSESCGSTPFTRTVARLSDLPQNALGQHYFGCNQILTRSAVQDRWQLQLPSVPQKVTLVAKMRSSITPVRLISSGQAHNFWEQFDHALFPHPNSVAVVEANLEPSNAPYQFFTVLIEPNRNYCNTWSASTILTSRLGEYFGCLGVSSGSATFKWIVPHAAYGASARVLQFQRNYRTYWPEATDVTVETTDGDIQHVRLGVLTPNSLIFAPGGQAIVRVHTESAHALADFRAFMQVTGKVYDNDFCTTTEATHATVELPSSGYLSQDVCHGWVSGSTIDVSLGLSRASARCIGLFWFNGLNDDAPYRDAQMTFRISFGEHISYVGSLSAERGYGYELIGCFPTEGSLRVVIIPKGISMWQTREGDGTYTSPLGVDGVDVVIKHPKFCSGTQSEHIVVRRSNVTSQSFFCDGYSVATSCEWIVDFVDGAEFRVNASSIDIGAISLSLSHFDRFGNHSQSISLPDDDSVGAWQRVRAGTRLLFSFNPSPSEWAQPNGTYTSLLARALADEASAFDQVECARGSDELQLQTHDQGGRGDDDEEGRGYVDLFNFKVLLYNAEWLFWPAHIDKWQGQDYEHFAFVADALGQLDADLVGLVEVGDCRTLDELSAYLSSRSPQKSAYVPYLVVGDDTATGQNVGMLTRLPPVGHEATRFTASRSAYPIDQSSCSCSLPPATAGECTAGSAGVSKQLYTLLPVSNNLTVAFFLTHLIAFPNDGQRCVKREAQAVLIRDAVREALASGYEVIVAGDLNDFDPDVVDEAHSRPMSRVLEILKDNGTLINAASLINSAEQRPPYSCWFDANGDGRDQGNEEHTLIDHVLVSTSLAPAISSMRIAHEIPGRATNSHASDHWPLLVTFNFTLFLPPPTTPPTPTTPTSDTSHSDALTTMLWFVAALALLVLVIVALSLVVLRRCRRGGGGGSDGQFLTETSAESADVLLSDTDVQRELLDEADDVVERDEFEHVAASDESDEL
jgi:hypothetical protein